MRKLSCLLASVFAFTGCGKNKTNKVLMPAGHPTVHETVRIIERSADEDSVSQRRAGPQPLLLGPEALKEVYVGVFGSTPRNGINEPSLFTLAERDELGGFRLIKPASPTGAQSPADPATVRLSNVSSDYLFTLRKFAAGACQKLVDTEMADTGKATNKLIDGASPSVEKIDAFLSALLGYKSKAEFHFGAKDYKAAFEKMANVSPEPKTAAEKTNRLKAAYTHLCVALATDARVYIR